MLLKLCTGGNVELEIGPKYDLSVCVSCSMYTCDWCAHGWDGELAGGIGTAGAGGCCGALVG